MLTSTEDVAIAMKTATRMMTTTSGSTRPARNLTGEGSDLVVETASFALFFNQAIRDQLRRYPLILTFTPSVATDAGVPSAQVSVRSYPFDQFY